MAQYREIRRGGIIRRVAINRASGTYQTESLRRAKQREEENRVLLKKYENIVDIYNPITQRCICDGIYASLPELMYAIDVLRGIEKPIGIYKNTNWCIKASEIVNRIFDFLEKGKGEAMKKTSFKSVFNNVFNAYTIARMSLLEVLEDLEEKESAWKKAEKDTNMDRSKKTVIEADYIKAKEESSSIIASIREELAKNKEQCKKELDQLVKCYYKINPSMIDHDTIMLLEKGALNETDLNNLIETNKNNYTMLKIFEKHARDMGSIEGNIMADSVAKMTSRKELTDYQELCSLLDRGVTDNIAKLKSNCDYIEANKFEILDRANDFEILVD